MESFQTVSEILMRLLAAGVIGGLIGFERRAHHKAIGIAGMVLIAIGSTTFMLLAKQLSLTDPASISRTLQGLLSGIGFLRGGRDLQERTRCERRQGGRSSLDHWCHWAGHWNLILVARASPWVPSPSRSCSWRTASPILSVKRNWRVMGAKPTIPARLEKRSELRFYERQFRRQVGMNQDPFWDLWFEFW